MKFLKQSAFFAALTLSSVAFLQGQEAVLPYNPKTDYDSVLAIFKENEKNLATDPKVNIVEIAKKMLPHETCKPYVYKKDDKIIGCILPSISAGMAMIQMVAIDKQYQGKGYGTKFLHEVLQDFQKSHKVTNVTLTTGNGPDHIPARKLYEKAGFKKLDLTPFLSALPEKQRKELISSMEKNVQYNLILGASKLESSPLKDENKEPNKAA